MNNMSPLNYTYRHLKNENDFLNSRSGTIMLWVNFVTVGRINMEKEKK